MSFTFQWIIYSENLEFLKTATAFLRHFSNKWSFRHKWVRIFCFIETRRCCFIRSPFANCVKSISWFYFFFPFMRWCISWYKILQSWQMRVEWNSISLSCSNRGSRLVRNTLNQISHKVEELSKAQQSNVTAKVRCRTNQ